MTSIKTYIPKFDFAYFTTIAMLVFSVGGAEKISPYVNNIFLIYIILKFDFGIKQTS